MSQKDFLRKFDRMAFGHFIRAGVAFSGVYRAPGIDFTALGQSVCGCLDRGIEFYGEFGQVAGRRDEMTLLINDTNPVKGGHVDADSGRFLLAEKLDIDESAVRWVVREIQIVLEPQG